MSGHMVLQVWCERAEMVDGTVYPASYIEDIGTCPACENEQETECACDYESVGVRWFAEYTAPGYMDRTDFCVAEEGPIAAAYEAFGMYGDDEKGSDDRRELAQVIRQARAQGYKS